MKYYILDKIFKCSCSVPTFESLGQATGLGQKYSAIRFQTAKLSELSVEHLGLSLGLSAHLGSYRVRRLGKTTEQASPPVPSLYLPCPGRNLARSGTGLPAAGGPPFRKECQAMSRRGWETVSIAMVKEGRKQGKVEFIHVP